MQCRCLGNVAFDWRNPLDPKTRCLDAAVFQCDLLETVTIFSDSITNQYRGCTSTARGGDKYTRKPLKSGNTTEFRYAFCDPERNPGSALGWREKLVLASGFCKHTVKWVCAILGDREAIARTYGGLPMPGPSPMLKR